MKNCTKAVLTLAGSVGAMLLAGCVVTGTTYVRDEPRRGYGPPPDRVVYAPAPGPYVIVHRPVPAPYAEGIPPAPGPGFIWIRGYWVAQGDNWVWVRGHYERPPRTGAVWVEPRYEPHGTDIHFSVGVWR